VVRLPSKHGIVKPEFGTEFGTRISPFPFRQLMLRTGPRRDAVDREPSRATPPFNDLQRTPSGQVILVEGRNDENLVIAQIHIAFQKFHNAWIDQGLSFSQAQNMVRPSASRIPRGVARRRCGSTS
jgi:hypothetical protein